MEGTRRMARNGRRRRRDREMMRKARRFRGSFSFGSETTEYHSIEQTKRKEEKEREETREANCQNPFYTPVKCMYSKVAVYVHLVMHTLRISTNTDRQFTWEKRNTWKGSSFLLVYIHPGVFYLFINSRSLIQRQPKTILSLRKERERKKK